MLRSMTGHGEARKQVQDKRLSVEVRSVNHRHLKVVVRGPDWFQAREAEVEKVARRFAKRGSLTVHLDWRTDGESSGGRLNLAVIDSYIDQLKSRIPKVPVEILGAILFLPGVASVGSAEPSDHSDDWATVESTLVAAMENLSSMRLREGAAMRKEFVEARQRLISEVAAISERAPKIVEAHSERLTQRVRQALAQAGIPPAEARADVVREVALLAERLDIAEELVRINCHFDQFLALLDDDDCPGRKIDFLLQEMLRETNTIGSKSADVEVARRVVNIKSILEQVRELVQNVE
jgi:uncharacterized protein (TIGR00255 family)